MNLTRIRLMGHGTALKTAGLLLLFVMGGLKAHAGVTNVLFSTGFEAAESYQAGVNLVGQNGWTSVGSGGNSIASGYFPTKGQQAYVGFAAPNPGDAILDVWQPINADPVADGKPLVKFSTTLEIVDSTDNAYDGFYWAVYDQAVVPLVTLDFENSTLGIYYRIDDGSNLLHHTGTSFTNGVTYNLEVTMNFQSNTWNATLNGAPLVANHPITVLGSPLDLGDIDAVWVINDTNAPGDNYMVFDDYKITEETVVPPTATVSFLSKPAGGQASLHLVGDNGLKWAIDRSTDLTNWTALKTNVISGGSFDFVDTTATGNTNRFYRGRLVP